MTKKFESKNNFFVDDQREEQPAAVQPRATREAPEGYKPAYVEVKSKRVQLVFQPSIHERAKKAAEAQGISLNEYIHRLIDKDTK